VAEVGAARVGEAPTLRQGATIGILGGGQLGRMLAIAAAQMGYRAHIFEPGEDPPAGYVAASVTRAAYEDPQALRAFAGAVDVVTYEFENVPTAALEPIEDLVPVRPGRRALAVAQDRAEEKRFLEGLGIAVAPWTEIASQDDLTAAAGRLGLPAILKTRRFGYDGKGQVRLTTPAETAAGFDALEGRPAVLEAEIAFRREVSIIAARGLTGEVTCYDPGENVHRGGILHSTTVSGAVTKGIAADAALIAGRILNALDYVGILGVEMFDTARGLLVNEIAPRVHNSGHWTLEACTVDQFQQHIRAIAGWPLGDGTRHADAVMTNLIGAEVGDWRDWAAKGAAVHLYGKAEVRPGRKMGHVTRLKVRT